MVIDKSQTDVLGRSSSVFFFYILDRQLNAGNLAISSKYRTTTGRKIHVVPGTTRTVRRGFFTNRKSILFGMKKKTPPPVVKLKYLPLLPHRDRIGIMKIYEKKRTETVRFRGGNDRRRIITFEIIFRRAVESAATNSRPDYEKFAKKSS